MIKRTTFVLIALVLFSYAVAGQSSDCPSDRVCLTREQAAHYLTLEDTVKAKDAEIAAKNNEIATLKLQVVEQKEITVDVKIALAREVGEKTGAQQALMQKNAEFEFLLKNGRKKCSAFSVCIN